MSDLTSKDVSRPKRDSFPEGAVGDLRFQVHLNTWQYDEIERLQRERDAIEKAFREAGYVGDDLAAGVVNLRALFDAARASHEPSAAPPAVQKLTAALEAYARSGTGLVDVFAAANALSAVEFAPVVGWRPIETAPRDGTQLLTVVTGFEPSITLWFEFEGEARWTPDPESFLNDEEFREHWHASRYEPTHWMPVPKGPTATKGEG